MSHGQASVTLHDVPAIVAARPTIAPIAKVSFLVLVMIGIVGFVLTLRSDPTRAWSVFHVNFAYWFVLAAASTCFGAVFHICNAQWARPLRRIFEAPAEFFRWSLLAFLLLYLFGYEHIFSAHHHIDGGKGIWLSKNFMYIRDAVLLIFLGRKVMNLSLRQDIGAIRSGLTGVKKEDALRWHEREYDCYVENWGSDAVAEVAKAQHLKTRFSPAVVIIYSVALSLFAFDQIMSVDPLWISTLFGAFIFMSGVYVAMAWTSMGVGIAREIHPLFKAKIYRTTMHDLGKLLFGFGIFWTYLFWSQYLTIWYGNLPEETTWMILRTRVEPWHGFSWGILFCLFFYPFFFGLNKDGKTVPRLLFITGTVVAVGVWLLMFLLVVPTLSPHVIPLGWQELLITLGFLGAFLWCAARHFEKVPLIPFGDLYLKEHGH